MSFKPSNLQIPPPADENQFEDLCLDLYRAEFGGETQKNGRRGQSQKGVDIFAPNQSIGIQCKKRAVTEKITETELIEEVEKAKKFKPDLKQFIVATTCRRDAKIQETAREISEKHRREQLFSVKIHSWDEIKKLMDKYPGVYEKHYSDSTIISSNAIQALQSESRHQELNRIRDFLNENKPETAFNLLEKFEKDKENQLEDKERYRLLTHKAFALIAMQKQTEASALLIKALQFNKEDEDANTNCAMAYLIYGDLINSKKFIEKVKKLNPLNIKAHVIEAQIKYKEGQALEDIISSLPEAVREDHQTALVLSYISLKKKRYAEAKKYLNIFEQHRPVKATKQLDVFEQQNSMDIRDMARYADISLGLILAKPDVSSGRRIPENLKEELNKIIDIYRKLNKSNQYNELLKFNPDWYLHYALACELDGELNEAVYTIKNGMDKFPNDDHLKIELSRLLAQKGDIATSISILENHLILNSSTVSTSAKSTDEIQAEITEESFNTTLFLIDFYFQSRKTKKAQKLLDQVIQSSHINKEQKLEAEQYRVFRLISFDKIDEAEEKLNSFSEKNQNNIFILILKSKIENAREKEKASEGNASQAKKHKGKKIEYLREAFQLFKDKKYEKQTNQNNSYFESKEQLGDILQLSRDLYQSEMYPEAESLLEKITNQNLNHPEIFKLLHSYFKNGKNRQTVNLAEDLLKKFPDHPEPVTILFQLYQELGDTKKAVQYYENFIQTNQTDSNSIPIKLDLIHSYINSGQIEKARKLLKEDFNLSSLPSYMTNHLSIAYAKTGDIKKALETQYQNIEKNQTKIEQDSEKMELENTYFNLFIFLNKPKLSDFEKAGAFKAEGRKPEDTSFLHPKKADLDCYVRIKDMKSSEETDIIIEKDAKTYTPEHELSKAILGKKAEDQISFTGKTYQIREIKSKYIHKYQKIIKKAELRYGSKSFLKLNHIPTNPDIDIQELSKILRKFVPDRSKRQESVNQLFQFYRERKVTLGFIAKTTGRHPLETMGHLISSKKDKWISAFQGFECYDEAQNYLENKSNLLLDIFSLVMIHQIKMEKSLKNSKFNLYVCQSTIDSLTKFGDETAFHSKDGLLTTGFDEKGELRKSFVPAQDIKQSLNFWIKVKTWVEECCRIKPISSDFVLRRKERREWEQCIGKEFLDPLLALYNDPNIIFLSEDAILRALLLSIHQKIDKFQKREKTSSQPSVRLFDLIEYLKRKAVIERKEEIQFKAVLIKFNQTYVPIDHNILLFLLKEAEYSTNDPRFQRGLFFLGPVSNLSGVLHITADFFIELCQEPSLLPYRRQMIINEVLNRVSFGRNKKSKQTAHQIFQLVQLKTPFLPLLQKELYGYIIDWRKGKMY